MMKRTKIFLRKANKQDILKIVIILIISIGVLFSNDFVSIPIAIICYVIALSIPWLIKSLLISHQGGFIKLWNILPYIFAIILFFFSTIGKEDLVLKALFALLLISMFLWMCLFIVLTDKNSIMLKD